MSRHHLRWCHSGARASSVAGSHQPSRSNSCIVKRILLVHGTDDRMTSAAATSGIRHPSCWRMLCSRYSGVPRPGRELLVSVTLHRPDQRPFTATLSGMFHIKRHGITLYAKGLRVFSRVDQLIRSDERESTTRPVHASGAEWLMKLQRLRSAVPSGSSRYRCVVPEHVMCM
jgi:hypothetical protein